MRPLRQRTTARRIIILLLTTLTGLWAEEGLVVTPQSAVTMALAASQALKLEGARAEAARARMATMERQFLPSLLGTAIYTRSSPVDPGTITMGPNTIALAAPLENSYSLRLGLQQPLFTGSRLRSGVDQARANYDAARSDQRQRRRDVATHAERAYWSLVLAEEMEAVVDERVAAMRAHRDDAQRRLDQGAGTRSELLATMMRLSDVEALGSEARSGLALARARLNLLIGLAWDVETKTEGIVAATRTEGIVATMKTTTEDYIAKALASRSDLAALRSRVGAHEASLAIARSALFPNLFLTGSYALANPNPKAFPQRAGFEGLWDIGLLVSIDLGKIPASLSQADEARAGVEQARLALAQARDGATLDVVAAYLELAKSADRLAATASSVSLAEENLRVMKDRFANGLALASELSDAELSLLQARLDGTRSRIAWELAKVTLRDTLGEPAPIE